MNTPAFTNLLGVRVKGIKPAESPHEARGRRYEGTVMAVSYGEFFVDAPMGAQKDVRTPIARGFVLLVLLDDGSLHSVPVDGSGAMTTVIG